MAPRRQASTNSSGQAAALPGDADDSSAGAVAISIPGASGTPSSSQQALPASWAPSTAPIAISTSRGAAAAADSSDNSPLHSLSRSLAWGGGSFIAGHSAFGRHGGGSGQRTPHHHGGQLARSPGSGRVSLDHTPSDRAFARQQSGVGGPYLGLEPGLGLTTPLLDHHKQQHDKASAAAAAAASDTTSVAAAAGTPHSEVDADAARPFGSITAAAADGSAGEAAAAAAAAIAAAGAATSASRTADAKKKREQRTAALVFGLVNAIVGIPTMVSFAAIVYQDAVYKPLLGQLARMSFFSAALHQLMFTIFSTLPFAVGQPQDVGLIFLSAMATSIAEIGGEVGLTGAEIVGTAMLTLTVATTLVGILTWLVARFKLATLVQYVPLPVVGGYLGYVGYFCLAAGIGLGTNTTIDTFSSWSNLASTDALIKLAPTLAGAIALWLCMTRAESPWSLPLTLAAVPAAFHAYLLVSGTSLEQAQDAGWVLKPEGKSTQQFWELYSLFNIQDWRLDGVYLPGIARQIPKMLGLFFVVTFGSCLDVAAIQADMPFPIDFNSELGTVGLSNIFVGLSGSGYTGSYIFSQTIFSMRAGVAHWSHGAIIAALEGAIFLLPFSVVQYLPNFFFGALLTVFGIEIAGDWLVRSYSKVSAAEYALLLATFVSIMELELEMGVAAGILLCTIYFAVTYARANLAAVKVLPTRSAAVRSYNESHLLEALSGRLATVAMSGLMFFGSSVLMSDKVISLANDMVKHTSGLKKPQGGGSSVGHNSAAADRAKGTATSASQQETLSDLRIASLAVQGSGVLPSSDQGGVEGQKGLDHERLVLLEKNAPAFVILDFRRVLGVDATSAQTLASLAMVLRRMDVELVITRVTKPSIRRLLVAHGIISPTEAAGVGGRGGANNSSGGGARGGVITEEDALVDPEQQQPLLSEQEEQEEEDGEDAGRYCKVFDTLSGGAKYAEDRLLKLAESYGLLSEPLTGLTLHQFLSMHCSEALLTRGIDVAAVTAEVSKLGVQRTVAEGEKLFSFGEVPESFFLILKGVIEIQVKSLSLPHHSTRPLPAQLDVMEVERSFSSGQGAVVGVTDFVLRRLRSFQGVVASTNCTVVEISRAALEVMVTEVPEVATAMQAVLLRDACLSEVYAYEVLERAAAA